MRNVTFNLITRQIVGRKLLLASCQSLNEIPFMNAITGTNCRLFSLVDDRWRLYVPKRSWRLRLTMENLDPCSAVHPGRSRTNSRLARCHHWPGMTSGVSKFVRSCDACQQMKSGRQSQGLSQPTEVPQHPWQHISMDLTVGLPARGFDSIYTFVDRLTKCVQLLPTGATLDAPGEAQIYINNVFMLHGLSQSITCDQDPRFTAEFFKDVFQRLGKEIKFSMANHPQPDEQTERANRIYYWGHFTSQC